MSKRSYAFLLVFLVIANVMPAVAQQQPVSAESRLPIGGQNLGDSFADLVYTPLNPCRIIDTRLGGGFLTGGSTRSFFEIGRAHV